MARSSSTTVLVVVLVIIAIIIAIVIGLLLMVRFLESRRKMRQDARVEAAKTVGNTKRNHRRRFSQTEYDLPRSDTKRLRRFSTDGGSESDRWGHLLDDVDHLTEDRQLPLSSRDALQIESGPEPDSVAITISGSSTSLLPSMGDAYDDRTNSIERNHHRFLDEEDMMTVTPTDTVMQIIHPPVVVEKVFPWSHPISLSGCTEDLTDDS